MKKTIIASLFGIALLSACDEPKTTTVDVAGAAIIKGRVLADFEKVDTPFDSEPLDSVLVRVLWDSEDLAVITDGDTRTESIEVYTNADGEFSTEVMTTKEGVTFTIEFDEIEKEVSYNNGVATATADVIFASASTTVFVRTGETVSVDQDYEDDFKAGYELKEFGTITGVVEADLEQINTEDVPELAEGVAVTVKWEDNDGNPRSVATTTDASGVYSIEVPTTNVAGDFTVVFEEYAASINYNDGFRDVTGYSATFNKAEFTAIALSAGEQVTRNYNYDSDFKEGLPIFGIITGTVEARVNAIPGSESDQPVSNLTVRVTWLDDEGNTRGLYTTTNAQGVYSIEVPLVDADDFTIRFAEFVVDPYAYNNGSADVTDASATYAEFNTDIIDVSKGEERTFDRSNTTPSSIEG